MHDHRLPRHDRPPEPWLPHPGTPETPPAHLPLGGGDWPSSPVPAPQPGRPFAPASLPALPPDASAFARFIVGLVAGRKSIPVAVGFALLGPLGLFYVSFLNGVAALIVVPYAARTLAFGAAQAFRAGPDAVTPLAVFFCWLITVPWAVIAARRRNARRGV
jgi:hypothetical protein